MKAISCMELIIQNNFKISNFQKSNTNISQFSHTTVK